MLGFKQYLLEAMTYVPGKGNVFTSDAPAAFKREKPLPLALQAIERKDARLSAAIANLPKPQEPLSATPSVAAIAKNERRESKVAALKLAKIEQQKKTSEENKLAGGAFLQNLIGSGPTTKTVYRKDESGKVVKDVQKVAGSGIFGALAQYDRVRQQQGVAFRKTPQMAAGVRQVGLNFATSDSPLLGGIGATIRGVESTKSSAIDIKNKLSQKLDNLSTRLQPEKPTTELSPEEKLKVKVNTGQIPAQEAGIKTRSLDMPGESQDELRQRMKGMFKSGLSPLATKKLEFSRKTGNIGKIDTEDETSV